MRPGEVKGRARRQLERRDATAFVAQAGQALTAALVFVRGHATCETHFAGIDGIPSMPPAATRADKPAAHGTRESRVHASSSSLDRGRAPRRPSS